MLFVSERLSFISSQTPAGLQSTRNDFAARSAPWNCLGVPREQALVCCSLLSICSWFLIFGFHI
eukprot:m.539123 g.539123  ORF g.539123 m.539123 type:complete len:64 (-) comp57631_c0_seq16:389-580(-)